jgi:hypothetical protein
MNAKQIFMKQFRTYAMIALGVLAVSCSEDDKETVIIQDTVERGAILRRISVPSPNFDYNDPSKEWAIVVEEQDIEDGALFSAVTIYASHTPSATGTAGAEAQVKSIPASEFSRGPNGLPRGEVAVSLTEVLTGLGVSSGQYESTDFFTIRLELVLTDGRTFSAASAGDTVAGGTFFASPFAYSAQFFCALDDASDFDGNYIVVTDAWADYAAGDVVPVQFVSGYTFRVLSTNNPFINNTSTAYMEVTIDPSDGSVSVASNEDFDYGVPIPVTGSGTVGTCTGDINLVLDFVGYATSQGFTLIKL